MPDGRQLWKGLSCFKPTILTSLPHGTWSEPQKRIWCLRELGPHIPVIACKRAQKPDYCTPGAILIDDNEDMREPWQQRQGIFIHHKSAQQTLRLLRKLPPLVHGLHLRSSPSSDHVSKNLTLSLLRRKALLYLQWGSALTRLFPLQWGSSTLVHGMRERCKLVFSLSWRISSLESTRVSKATASFRQAPLPTSSSSISVIYSSVPTIPRLPRVKGLVSIPIFKLNEDVKMAPVGTKRHLSKFSILSMFRSFCILGSPPVPILFFCGSKRRQGAGP